MPTFGFESTAEEVCTAFSTQITGRTFLITGTTAGGLGAKYATALAAHLPAHIILVSRSKTKVDPVIAEIHATNPEIAVLFVQCELSDQDSVRAAAATILDDASIPAIDVLINNAGVMAIAKYTLDKHGNELTLSSNHIGHFLLTNLLLPKLLAATRGARVVNLSSTGHRISDVHFADPGFAAGATYDPWTAYGQSKTANVLFTTELARRLAGRDVRAFALNPGLIMETGLGSHLDFSKEGPALVAAAEKNNPGSGFSLEAPKSTSQGSSTTLVAALDPALEAKSGAYLDNCQVRETMPYAVDAENAKKLWAYSEELVGQKFDV